MCSARPSILSPTHFCCCLPRRHCSRMAPKTPCNAEISRLSENIFKRGAAFSALENLSYEYCFYPGGWGISKGLVFINVKESRLAFSLSSPAYFFIRSSVKTERRTKHIKIAGEKFIISIHLSFSRLTLQE